MDGKRAIGTKVYSNVANIVLNTGKEYVGEATILNNLYQTKYIPIKDSKDKVVGIWFVGVNKEITNNIILKLMLKIGIVNIFFLVLSIIIIFIFVNSLKKNINKISMSLNSVSNGDLNQECIVKSKDEFGEISGYVNSMILNLKEIVQKLQGSSKMVDSSSGNLLAISNEMSSVSESIANSVAEEISASSEQIAAASEELNASSEEVTATAHILNSMTKEIVDIASKFTL